MLKIPEYMQFRAYRQSSAKCSLPPKKMQLYKKMTQHFATGTDNLDMSTIFKNLASVMSGFKIAPSLPIGARAVPVTLPASLQNVPVADLLGSPVQGLSVKAPDLLGALQMPASRVATLAGGNGSKLGTAASLSKALARDLKNSPFNNKTADGGSPPSATNLQRAVADDAVTYAAASGMSFSKQKTAMDIIAKL